MLPAVVQSFGPLLHQRAGRYHLLELGVQAMAAGGTQQGMQRRPVLGIVDMFPGKQPLDVRRQAAVLCQLQQRRQDRPVKQVLGVIQADPGGLEGEGGGPFGIPGEQLLYGRRSQLVRQHL